MIVYSTLYQYRTVGFGFCQNHFRLHFNFSKNSIQHDINILMTVSYYFDKQEATSSIKENKTNEIKDICIL